MYYLNKASNGFQSYNLLKSLNEGIKNEIMNQLITMRWNKIYELNILQYIWRWYYVNMKYLTIINKDSVVLRYLFKFIKNQLKWCLFYI